MASIGLAVLFGVSGTVNILYLAAARKEGQHLQISSGLSRFVGGCQLAGATGLIGGMFWHPCGIAAAVGLMLLMVGAVILHGRVGDPVRATLPAVGVFVLAGFVVGGHLSLMMH
ncbi:DoxX family protein [Mycolicibacterium farcinogenes]|nr:DoxX family protein [Mycolicibacterium farcinogenes]